MIDKNAYRVLVHTFHWTDVFLIIDKSWQFQAKICEFWSQETISCLMWKAEEWELMARVLVECISACNVDAGHTQSTSKVQNQSPHTPIQVYAYQNQLTSCFLRWKNQCNTRHHNVLRLSRYDFLKKFFSRLYLKKSRFVQCRLTNLILQSLCADSANYLLHP